MASWQDPSAALLSKLDVNHINVTQLQSALKDCVDQIKVHLDRIIDCEKEESLEMHWKMYEILLEVDTMMNRLKEIEQRMIELSS